MELGRLVCFKSTCGLTVGLAGLRVKKWAARLHVSKVWDTRYASDGEWLRGRARLLCTRGAAPCKAPPAWCLFRIWKPEELIALVSI